MPEDNHRRPQLARRRFLKNSLLPLSVIPLTSTINACSNNSGNNSGSELKTVNWSNFTLYMPVDDNGAFPLVESCSKELNIKISYTEDIDDNAGFFAKV
ncbi:MAG: hypothetical protein ACKOXS_07590, partial [Actinomycetes bacterium]